MAETTNQTFGKHKDGEDPAIVAQRFLNIFRQLHIFSTERKEAFNKMILEQPANIRGMFGSLPGGSLLQQYVDDLETKYGVTRDKSEEISAVAGAPEMDAEISKAKILATALAEAQAQATAKMQQSAAAIPPMTAAQPVQQAVPQFGGTAKIVADASFAKEIAAAFSQAMKFSESARQNETKELTNAILESQNKLAQMLVQNNQAAANVSNTTTAAANNNANNIQINTTPFPPIEDIVSGIVRAQSQLFREMAETQTKELSAIISVALKESHQLSTQAIIDAIKTLQKENLKILEMQAKTTPVYAERPLYADRNEKAEMPKNLSPEGFADKFIKNKREQNSQSSLSDDEEESGDEEDLPAPEPIRLTEIDASEPLQKKKKKKKKKKNKSRDDFNSDAAVNEDIFATGGFADKNNGGLDASLFDFSDLSESPATAADKDFDRDFSFDKAFAADTAESDPENHDFNFDDVELPSLEEKTDSRKATDFSFDEPDKILDTESYSDQQEQASAESPLPEENEDEWEYVEIPAGENAANLNSGAEKWSDEDASAETDTSAAENISADSDDGWEYEEVPEEEALAGTDLSDAAYEETTAEDSSLTDEEQTTDVAAEPEAETDSADFAADENGTQEGEGWEWEYEEVPEDEAPAEADLSDAHEETTAEDSSLTDEEQTTDAAAEPEAETDSADFAADENGTQEGEDWEWEYEEVPEDETPAEADLADAHEEMTAEDSSLADEEQTTDVAAEPEAETGSADFAADENGTQEGEDWEWEYEEVPEDETPAEADLADAHEEMTAEESSLTDEEQTTDVAAEPEAETGSAGFAADENGTQEGEDWEWEYEEVPEDENRKQEYKNYDQELAQVLDDETPLPDQKRPDGQDDFSPDSAYLSETGMPDLETPHKENISTGTEETPDIAEPAAETGEKTDEPLWNEPISDTENGQEENSYSETAAALKENSLPAAEKADTGDLPENDENGISGVPGDFNPLYSGDLIFHENVYNQPQPQAVPDFDMDIGITDVSEGKSDKEPYSPKN